MTTWEGYDLEIHEMALNAYENRTDHKSTIQKGSKKGGFGGVPRVSRMTTFGCSSELPDHANLCYRVIYGEQSGCQCEV